MCLWKKKFQNQYSNDLDKNKLCISCGLIDDFSIEKSLKNFRRALGNNHALKSNTKKNIDSNGLKNIAKIVINEIKKLI